MNSGSNVLGYYFKIKLKISLTKTEQCQRRRKNYENIILTSMLTEIKQILNDDDVKQKESMTGEWVQGV
jgi:hypothetical protein